MHKEEKIIVAATLLLAISLLTVYSVQNFLYSPSVGTVYSSVVGGLQLSLSLDAKTTTYKQGQTINVTVALTNISQKPLNVSFDNSFLCFEVRDSENFTIGAEESPVHSNGTSALAPQKSVSDVLGWNTGSYRNSPPASVGVYQFVGYLVEGLTTPNSTSSYQTTPLNITITQANTTPNPSNQQYSTQH